MVLFPGCSQPAPAMKVHVPIAPALLGLALIQAPTALLAQQGPVPGSRLTPQQRQQLFPQQKQLWLQQSRARISSLQTAERCVQAAQTPDALMDCLQRERQSNMRLRRSHWAEMRALYSRYGIQLPEQKKRYGGPGAPGAQAGGDV